MLFPEGKQDRHNKFAAYTEEFGKSYESTEHATRRVHFHKNLRLIQGVNRQGLSYHLDVNHMADWSDEERDALRGRVSTRPRVVTSVHTPLLARDQLPATVDWRTKGAVTPAKDQGTCGSCWAFGTTGAIEGAVYVLTGKLIPLSEQVLMDCSWPQNNNACDGGEDFQAYQWVLSHGGGMPSEKSYPYLNQDGFCTYNSSQDVAFIKEYVSMYSYEALNDALATHGPVAVSIDATPHSFYFYAGGLYNNAECKGGVSDLDHSVLAVGYVTVEGQKYTILKNSWSSHWGDNGFALVAQANNICGVGTMPTYPVASLTRTN